MTQLSKQDLPFLEILILDGLQELKGIESGLDRQFASGRLGSAKARVPFLRKLADLRVRTLLLERLVDSLDNDALDNDALDKNAVDNDGDETPRRAEKAPLRVI